MDRLHLMRVFAAVAEAESFNGGARRLGLSPPAVTRAIAGLEQHLGVRLFTRTTRRVRVTDAGQRYLDAVRRLLVDVEEADASAIGATLRPRGRLAITAPTLFGRLFVMPGVIEYLQRYPEMSVTALLVDRVVDLIDEGQDVGVRIGQLADSTLQAIPVGQVRRVVCAAPRYLAARGTPQTPAELTQHAIISAGAVTPGQEWRFEHHGRSTRVRVEPRLTVTSNEAAIAAALAGAGLTMLLSYQVGQPLASGALVTVLQEFESPGIPIHVVHREGRLATAKVRAFVELMVERLRAEPVLHQARPP